MAQSLLAWALGGIVGWMVTETVKYFYHAAKRRKNEERFYHKRSRKPHA